MAVSAAVQRPLTLHGDPAASSNRTSTAWSFLAKKIIIGKVGLGKAIGVMVCYGVECVQICPNETHHLTELQERRSD